MSKAFLFTNKIVNWSEMPLDKHRTFYFFILKTATLLSFLKMPATTEAVRAAETLMVQRDV